MIRSRDLLSQEDRYLALEFIQNCFACLTMDGLSSLIEELKAMIACEFAVGVFVETGRRAIDQSCVVNASYPEEWCRLYCERDFQRMDPVVKEGCRTDGLQYWSDTYRRYRGAGPFISSSREFGLKEGYTHALRSHGRRRSSLFSFSAATVGQDPRTELLVEYLVPHLHQAFSRITGGGKRDRGLRDVQFSTTEREILKWARDGRNLAEIGDLVGTTRTSLLCSIGSLFSKIETTNKNQAVAIALEQGLIGFD